MDVFSLTTTTSGAILNELRATDCFFETSSIDCATVFNNVDLMAEGYHEITDKTHTWSRCYVGILAGVPSGVVLTIRHTFIANWDGAIVGTFNDDTPIAKASIDDKDITASVTTADGQTSGASFTKAPLGYPQIMVGDAAGLVQVPIGNGVKTKSCYASRDGGATALSLNSLKAGDTVYWNGSIAGYELSTSMLISYP
jgi:hypothetical protein